MNDKDTVYYDTLVSATQELQEHLFYSEFGGHLDYDDDDPWIPLYNGLSELRGKLKEEQEMCELTLVNRIDEQEKE